MSYAVLGDWGTTRLRLYRFEGGACVAQLEGLGIGQLSTTPDAYLSDILAPWLAEAAPSSITLCGMAGARTGLQEVAYVETPALLAAWRAGACHITWRGIPTTIAAGVALPLQAAHADVMRGEETQIYGALALGATSSLFVLPGTHSKWVCVEAGAIMNFKTFITGELYALLTQHSTLARTPDTADDVAQAQGFASGLEQAQASTEISAALFTARAAQLRHEKSPAWGCGYISGLLIGGEVQAMQTEIAKAASITLIGAPQLCAAYKTALARFTLPIYAQDGNACARKGLELLHAHD